MTITIKMMMRMGNGGGSSELCITAIDVNFPRARKTMSFYDIAFVFFVIIIIIVIVIIVGFFLPSNRSPDVTN